MDTDTPDVWLGLLQSSFIIGFSVSILIFSSLLHYYPPFFVCACGLSVWVIAVFMCFTAKYTGSYYFLLIFRMLSGVGEASFQCSIPPWITKKADPKSRGAWLSIFYTAIPVGTACGYAFSAAVSENAGGWQWAFFIEGVIMVPFVIFLFATSYRFPMESEHNQTDEKIHDDVSNPIVDSTYIKQSAEITARHESAEKVRTQEVPSLWTEVKLILSKPIFLCTSMGYAAQNAALIGLSTFGSAFIIGIGFWDTETEASSIFGVVISVAGLVGTPLGGWLIDYYDEKLKREALENNQKDGISAAKAPVRAAAMITTIFSIVGFCLMFVLYFIDNKWLYMIDLCLGCTFLFTTTTGINLLIMFSVPEINRPFAVALNSVFIHALGDVPSPIIVGYLKDIMAPACSGGDDDSVSSSDACRGNEEGLRQCMLIVILWLSWCVVMFGLDWRFTRTLPKTLEHLELEARKKAMQQEEEESVNVRESLIAKKHGNMEEL